MIKILERVKIFETVKIVFGPEIWNPLHTRSIRCMVGKSKKNGIREGRTEGWMQAEGGREMKERMVGKNNSNGEWKVSKKKKKKKKREKSGGKLSLPPSFSRFHNLTNDSKVRRESESNRFGNLLSWTN